MLEDETQRSIQEWTIPYDELSFGKKIVDHPTHSVFSGKWHGDVIIHTFKTRYVHCTVSTAFKVSSYFNRKLLILRSQKFEIMTGIPI